MRIEGNIEGIFQIDSSATDKCTAAATDTNKIGASQAMPLALGTSPSQRLFLLTQWTECADLCWPRHPRSLPRVCLVQVFGPLMVFMTIGCIALAGKGYQYLTDRKVLIRGFNLAALTRLR